MDQAEIFSHNRDAWNAQVKRGNRWTVPVDSTAIEKARRGEVEIVLTPRKQVPAVWFPKLTGCRVLMLASGGGQQTPIMAAAGATVTVLDLSDEQLKQDQFVADREGLSIRTVQGSMDKLDMFGDESFDLIIHPCSNSFVPDVKPVWREASRVLRTGGTLIAGFTNPIAYAVDYLRLRKGELVFRHSIPYSDCSSISDEERKEIVGENEPLCFGHSLEDLLAGQTAAGLAIVDLYEDYWGEGEFAILDRFLPSFIATKSIKVAKQMA